MKDVDAANRGTPLPTLWEDLAQSAYESLIASGFAVVQVEPTDAMIEAGEIASRQSTVRGSKVAHIYRAMCRAKDE
jgi:hypothetical protein